MKKLVFSLIVGAIFVASGATAKETSAKDTATKTSAPKELGDVFTGDKKYYSITAKKAHKQAQKRQAFLDLCPR